jgi:hopanoid biosynthesis associated protein HpnK
MKTAFRQLIVNADDFGLTEGVNQGIVHAHNEGIVTSATLMANGAAFDSAVSLSRRAPYLGIGVHLNLTAGQPVTPGRMVPSLVDRHGRLHWSPGRLLQALVAGQVSLLEIEIELRRQIAKVCKTGIRPTHLDGHKHMHLLPGVSDILIRLAVEFSIPAIRCPREVAPDLSALLRGAHSQTAVARQFVVARAVSVFARRFGQKLAKAGLLFATRFYGLSQTGFLDVKDVLDIMATLPEGVSELMCHPGRLDDDLVKSGTRLLVQREIEIGALTAPIVKKVVADRGIELISYEQLEGSIGGARNPCGVFQTRSMVR